MSVRNQLKLLVGGINARRNGRGAPSAPSAMSEFLERSRVIAVFIFIVTVAAIVVISSVGITTLNTRRHMYQPKALSDVQFSIVARQDRPHP
jgi:hypothetical protein